jgi:hypothetical protein
MKAMKKKTVMKAMKKKTVMKKADVQAIR